MTRGNEAKTGEKVCSVLCVQTLKVIVAAVPNLASAAGTVM